jgi:hypothetical protein
VDRARPRLTASLILVTLLPLATACTTGGSPVTQPTDPPTTTVTRANPTPSGYPVAKGRQVQLSQGQTGTVELTVGDVLAAPRPTMGTRPSGDVLVLAEVTDTRLIYQAVAAGRATLATDDPPPPPTCRTTPCPPGRAAPPVVTVEVTRG